MADLDFRPARLDDAAFFADVMTELRPTFPRDPVVLRHEWATQSESWTSQRYVVARRGDPIGFAGHEHPRWELVERRWAGIFGDLRPTERRHVDDVLATMEERALAEGATLLRTRGNEDDAAKIAAILRRGFHEDRRGRRWQLDLLANRERLLAMTRESRERMRREGIRLLTLAEDRDPRRYEKFWRMSEEAVQDIPTTIPHVPESLDDYMKWFRSPDLREDRFWLARIGDEIVGASVLAYPPARGVVSTAWTATARSVRGRGVARALKCETVAQAIGLGVDRVWTGNDAANDPILHLNATMGYVAVPGSIEFLKP